MKKYYANAVGSQTIRMVKAENDEEALKKFQELFGNNDFVAGFLPHAEPSIPWKEQREYYKAGLSIAGCGEYTDSAMKIIDDLHSIGAI